MVLRMRYLLQAVAIGFFAWSSWVFYGYFFDKNLPQIDLLGLDELAYYCNDLHCTLIGKDSYKIGNVSVWLDDKTLVKNFKINKREFEYEIPIDTATIVDGKHTLKVEVENGTFSKNKSLVVRDFYVDNVILQAAFIKPASECKILQGRTFHLQFQVNKPIKSAVVKIASNSYDCFAESLGSNIFEAYIPIKAEEKPNEYPLSVEIVDQVGSKLILEGKFQVMAAAFKKQSLHIDPKKVKAEKEQGRKQSELEQELGVLFAKSPKTKLWQGTFYTPMEYTSVATEFGVQRITPEKGCYAHNAIDLLAMPRSVIWAPQEGRVVIKDRYEESGNTVVIDHGLGVFTLLFHLEEFSDINVGDKLKRGNPVGKMGKTGYASGYHLHWEMQINGVKVDPQQWTRDGF
jgi:murein DD-endopeptidase MepM/ murein hydrolase activator NlpD